MTRLECMLDTVHEFSTRLSKATRRKAPWDRQRIISTIRSGSTVFSLVSGALMLVCPHLRGVALANNLSCALDSFVNSVQKSPNTEISETDQVNETSEINASEEVYE